MLPIISKLSARYSRCGADKNFWFSTLLAFILLAGALLVNFYASNYATASVSGSVTDVILSNTRVYEVDGVFTYGAIILWLIITGLCLFEPKYIPFTVKSIVLFILIRSVFISLTHISPYPFRAAISSTLFANPFFQGIFTGDDLFFSGHTGLPFLLALIFWRMPAWRVMFLGFSLLFGAVVLLGHLHYSIDVLAAFFIVYSIFNLAKAGFKKDWQRCLL